MGWLLEDEVSGTAFDELAGAHDGDVCGELRDDGKAMGDQHIGEVKFLLELLEELEDLRTDRDIERGDRFIGNDE